MITLPIGTSVKIVPTNNRYHIGFNYKLGIMKTEIHIDPDKHTLEGPWEVISYSRKNAPLNKVCLKWNNSKFLTHVRHDWIQEL